MHNQKISEQPDLEICVMHMATIWFIDYSKSTGSFYGDKNRLDS